MLDVEVIPHQQHRPRGQLKDVLAGAVGQDRLKPSQAAGSHHDQVGLNLIGNLEHRLLGVALANQGAHA